MNVITILHTKAMEFVDEALLAKMEGNMRASQTFMEKAFSLEKEAAYLVSEADTDPVPRHILLRSAATLAANAGNFIDAQALITLSRASSPPAFIEQELQELEQQIQAKQEATFQQGESLELIGIIIDANASKHQITIREIDNQLPHTIRVPQHLMNDIVKSYWSEKVRILTLRNPQGEMILERIDRAA